MDTKYIFVTGGVISSLGKGIASAALSTLLEARGFVVSHLKLDPYINVDPGTMSPYQHGEVYVTDDGTETDLDLGHYERFTNFNASVRSNYTSGKIYETVIQKERRGEYLGKTVQVVPHVTNQIKECIIKAGQDGDICIVEIGGTVGDIESLPFLEAIRQFHFDVEAHRVLYIHLTLIPFIPEAGELKTKPTQHSVNKMREIGIQPDILICRTDRKLELPLKQKLAMFTNVSVDSVITAKNVSCIYEIPLLFKEEKLDHIVLKSLDLPHESETDLREWEEIVQRFYHPHGKVTVAFVGKYATLKDSYKSYNEALIHAGIKNNTDVVIDYIHAEEFRNADFNQRILEADCVLVPGGYGERGTEGKIKAAMLAREHNIPFFGVCLGFQLAVIEFARHVVGLPDAGSAEFGAEEENNIIDIMEDQKTVVNLGGSMRLGSYPCKLKEGSKIRDIYGTELIHERHRHRFELNNRFIPLLEQHGLKVTGYFDKGNLAESLELTDHSWFLAVQYHPEYKSKPFAPHPLYVEFIRQAKLYAEKKIHKSESGD